MDLSCENALIYAMKMYNSPKCIISEFEEDYLRFKYIRRLIRKYKYSEELKERLILNHLIVLGNVFGVEASVRLLFLKNDPVDYPIIKTFLLFLNYMPDTIKSINTKDILSSDIPVDMSVATILRKI